MTAPPNAWGVLGNASPVFHDLHHAAMHAADELEDAEGFMTWNGRSPNAMNSADREESARLDRERKPAEPKRKRSGGPGPRAWGNCETCGVMVSGERRFCGICLARRMDGRVR